MYDYVTDNVLNAMYAPNDRLGVELMGAVKWNALKKTVAKNTVNKLNQVNGGNRSKFLNKVVSASNKIRNSSISGIPNRVVNAPRSISKAIKGIFGDPLCDELFGMNEEYAEELLGYSLGDFVRQTKKITHKVLEAGENVPVIDAAVDRFRGITGAITGTSKAVDVAQTAYDNRGKIILIGGGAAILLYLLLRKKK